MNSTAFASPCWYSSTKARPSSINTVGIRNRRPAWRCAIGAALSKAELLQTILPLNGGRVCLNDSAMQRQVLRVIRDTEGYNPSVRPLEDPNLPGTWEVVFTTSESILGSNRPAFLRPVVLRQVIAPGASRITNVEVIRPFGEGPRRPEIVSKVEATATPESKSRVGVQFQRFELLNGLIKRDVSNSARFSGWLEVTYLDEDMRISRGDRGNVFVLLRKDDAPVAV